VTTFQTPLDTEQVAHPTAAQRAEAGKAARAQAPRTSHGEWSPPADRFDPVQLLMDQEETRVPDLIPIRHGRMAASAFAFYRGAANVLAADLAPTPRTGLTVQLCGDAHLANFGGFASPERNLLFDVNDFDETHPGPFEWDVKRLVASLEVATRARNFDKKTRAAVVAGAARTYRETMRTFAGQGNLAVWYARLDIDAILSRWGTEAGSGALKNFDAAVTKAESKDQLKAKAKLTEVVDGELRFRRDPPLLVPAEEIFSDVDHQAFEDSMRGTLRNYRRTLADDRRHLLESYQFVALARKVVGVGSVGTRCWVALMVGRDLDDPLFLQVKQAEASVLEPYLGASSLSNHGQRVVEGQHLMQAAGDIFLGWERVIGPDGVARDYYMRQLWDWKFSANIDTMPPSTLLVYAQMCGWILARAHARSGDRVAIAAYLGSSTVFDQAMSRFATTYADQNERDHHALVDAIARGRIAAEAGI
jgi:uncharacterized protein (DUF2252 family)